MDDVVPYSEGSTGVCSGLLMLLPGLLNDAALWSELRVTAPGVRLLQPELPAFNSLADVASTLLDQMPPRFALAGFSMGGYIALEIYRQSPERVEALALLASSGLPDTPGQARARQATIAAVEAGRFEKVLDVLVRTAVSSVGPNAETARHLLIDMARRCGEAKFLSHLRSVLSRQDVTPILAGIACPTLVVVGSEDRVIAPASAAATASQVAGSRFVSIASAGHMLPLEAAAELSALLDHWLGA